MNEQELRSAWQSYNVEAPKKMFAISVDLDKEEVLLVVSDKTNIYSFMDAEGKIYYISSGRCKVEKDAYVCSGPLYSAGCIMDTERASFVREYIAPLFYTSTF